MEKTSVRLPMVRLNDAQIPFVEGSFVIKDGRAIKGFFLLDSCSTQNVLNYKAVQYLREDDVVDSGVLVVAIGHRGETCKKAKVNITVGDVEETTDFCISHNLDFRQMFGSGVIGILGSNFLRKHHFVLDFDAQRLRHADEEVDRSNMSFFCPMEYGFVQYGVPAVVMMKDEQEYVFLADTGCNVSTTTQYGIENATDIIESQDRHTTLAGVFGTEKISSIVVSRFSLASIGMKDNSLEPIDTTDELLVLSNMKYVIEPQNKDYSPVCGMIGCGFMLRHKWILDFHNGVIYAKKD